MGTTKATPFIGRTVSNSSNFPFILNARILILDFSLKCREFYLTSAGWVADGNRQVSTVYMMRSQNYSVVSTCFADHNWECIEVFPSIYFYRIYHFASLFAFRFIRNVPRRMNGLIYYPILFLLPMATASCYWPVSKNRAPSTSPISNT